MKHDDPGSNGPDMTGRRRYGDPRKDQAVESAKRERERSKREFSGGFLLFILFAWVVFFVLWLAAGSLLVAAIVFGVLLLGGIAVFNAK
jgi:anti-sigma factor RsiW